MMMLTMTKSGRGARTLFLLPVLLLAGVSGCDRSPSDTGEHTLGEVRLHEGTPQGAVVATWTANGGWSPGFLELRLSAPESRLALGVRAFTAGGRERTLGGSYSMRWSLAAGAMTGVVVNDDSAGQRFLGDQIRIYGLAPGTTRIQVVLWHSTHEDGATDPLEIRVVP
jgi:hypothetical protein